ncbi:uncharacterized protein BJ171DRAFT_513111 [Polychytrium aggregatum]|uniref:uncharacterized protein n=1 Tax=Polychytrium aggregatum TaxID=110093 RepID=UPI0022FEF18F|nr:uncharacterized protein BJ171DRAFT_513111 [Polychytrium aggregatum]KAI9202744.1 hypothetical protein BJ171DRAFT_513111 [Polychytrium aggregatum]
MNYWPQQDPDEPPGHRPEAAAAAAAAVAAAAVAAGRPDLTVHPHNLVVNPLLVGPPTPTSTYLDPSPTAVDYAGLPPGMGLDAAALAAPQSLPPSYRLAPGTAEPVVAEPQYLHSHPPNATLDRSSASFPDLQQPSYHYLQLQAPHPQQLHRPPHHHPHQQPEYHPQQQPQYHPHPQHHHPPPHLATSYEQAHHSYPDLHLPHHHQQHHQHHYGAGNYPITTHYPASLSYAPAVPANHMNAANMSAFPNPAASTSTFPHSSLAGGLTPAPLPVDPYGSGMQTPDSPDDRPFRCPDCPKTFLRKQDLRRHAIIHDPVSPGYKCTHCGTSFTRSDALYRHVKGKRCL